MKATSVCLEFSSPSVFEHSHFFVRCRLRVTQSHFSQTLLCLLALLPRAMLLLLMLLMKSSYGGPTLWEGSSPAPHRLGVQDPCLVGFPTLQVAPRMSLRAFCHITQSDDERRTTNDEWQELTVSKVMADSTLVFFLLVDLAFRKREVRVYA